MIGGVFSVYYVPCYRGNSVRNELGRLCSDKMGQMFEGTVRLVNPGKKLLETSGGYEGGPDPGKARPEFS